MIINNMIIKYKMMMNNLNNLNQVNLKIQNK